MNHKLQVESWPRLFKAAVRMHNIISFAAGDTTTFSVSAKQDGVESEQQRNKKTLLEKVSWQQPFQSSSEGPGSFGTVRYFVTRLRCFLQVGF